MSACDAGAPKRSEATAAAVDLLLHRPKFEKDHGIEPNPECPCVAGAPERSEAAAAAVDLPLHNLLFDGRALWRLDYSEFTQGVGALCLD